LDETCIEIFLDEFFERLLFRCQKRVYGANQRLSTFFQIDFEVIKRMMRSKGFSVKNIRSELNFSYFLSYFYFIFDLFSFILFLELGLGLE